MYIKSKLHTWEQVEQFRLNAHWSTHIQFSALAPDSSFLILHTLQGNSDNSSNWVFVKQLENPD